jgi:3-oxoacyl-[acyl-carrier protein] reductase
MRKATFNFEGENVLVIGGSRGIGKRVCELFIHFKAKNVYSIARTSCDLKLVKNIICDISDTDELLSSLKDIREDIDILVNVAGTNLCEPIDFIDWDRVISVNLKSFFTTIKCISPGMIRRKGGKIVNVSSIAGRSKSIVSGAHYTSSKYGIIGLTKQMAQERWSSS